MRIIALLFVAACQVTTTDNFPNPPPGPPASCTPAAALPGCDQGSIAYACTRDRPDDGDANLACSSGTPGALGATLYCCAPIAQASTECAPDPAIAGCGGVAIGFACSGAVTPSDADPAIACSADLGGGTYCCNTAQPIATCAVDPTVACAGVAAGYRCAGGSAAPLPGGFTCTPSGQDGFCCAPTE
jgi:hypothetical protein